MESEIRAGMLKFNLDTSEGKTAHARACKADNAYGALWDITQQVMRQYRKYGLPQELQNVSNDDLVQELEKKVWQILEDNNINLYEEYE